MHASVRDQPSFDYVQHVLGAVCRGHDLLWAVQACARQGRPFKVLVPEGVI